MLKIPPNVVFWLMFLTTVGQGLSSGTVNLTGIVPADMMVTLDHWIELVDFIAMTFLTIATGSVGPGVGPLAKAPTVAEANLVMDQATKGGK